MTHENMSDVEFKIAKCLVETILKAGYSITVYDGGCDALDKSTEQDIILNAMATTDSDVLRVYDRSGKLLGWVLLVYGNGSDLIADNTVRINDLLKPAEALAERLAA